MGGEGDVFVLVGGDWADTELVEAVVEAVMMVVVSVEDFDGGCCCCWVHTSERGRAVAGAGTAGPEAATAAAIADFAAVVDATTPGEP